MIRFRKQVWVSLKVTAKSIHLERTPTQEAEVRVWGRKSDRGNPIDGCLVDLITAMQD